MSKSRILLTIVVGENRHRLCFSCIIPLATYEFGKVFLL